MSINMVQVTSKILEYLPKEARITRVEYEGPAIAIYSENPAILIYHGYVLTEIANKLKKRVVARSEPSKRLSMEDAREKIREILKPYTEVSNFLFDSMKGEVILYLKNSIDPAIYPNLSVKIVSETRWLPLFKRYFPPFPQTLHRIYSAYYTCERERRRFILGLGDRIFRSPLNPSKDVRVTVLGGAQEVGRSCFLFSTSETNLLIDFGLKPGISNRIHAYPRIDAQPFDIDELDAVIVTHAHLDHSGLIPFLFKHGYDGPVYMTEPTLPLVVLLQLDLIQVSEKNGITPPYTASNVRDMIYHAVPLKYNQVTDISPDVKLTLYNAGHVLGSSIVHLHVTEGVHNTIFTGDFKYGPSLLLDPAYHSFTRAESVVMESTYGGDEDVAPTRNEAESLLQRRINETIDRGGKVLMPVPAVGRAQELLVILDKLINSGGIRESPIFIEGMIDESTAIHVSYPEYLSNRLRKIVMNQGINPFESERFVAVDNPSMRDEAISNGPCIIIATSGMMEGGPVLEYFKHLAGDERNLILFTAYQVPGTLGRRILNGTNNVTMTDGEKMVTIRIQAGTQRIEGFSAHSDRKQLMAYVKRLSPIVKNLFLVHGEPEKSLSLAKAITKTFQIRAKPLRNLEMIPLT